MTEQEREEVEDTRNCGWESYTNQAVMKLIDIIDRLDKQLAEIKEAMKPVRFVVAHTNPNVDDNLIVYTVKLPGGKQYAYLELGQMRRLVEIMDEVEDGAK